MGHDRGVAGSRYLVAAYDGCAASGLTDGQLLERFAGRGGEASALAFASLVERHGPMVLRACRATLRDEHDAEDAFQAVFLVLARKAGSLWVRDSLGPWLLDVARRTSSQSRAAIVRRRARERTGVDVPDRAQATDVAEDPGPLLIEELGRLPDRYRSPLLLCDLEGLTHEEAARRLGWPIGTVKSRQSRGRACLRSRLIRRGLTPSSALLGTLSPKTAGATVPRKLVESTISAATRLAAGEAVASTAAVLLMKGVLAAMLLKRLKTIAGLTLFLGVAAAGVGLARLDGKLDDPPRPAAPQHRQQAPRPIREILREAARAIRAEKRDGSRAFGLIGVAEAQARAGDKDGARENAREASELAATFAPKIASNTLIYAAWARSAAGDREGGLKNLERAKILAEGLADAAEIFDARRDIALALVELGDREAASAIVGAMAEGVVAIPDQRTRFPVAREVVKAQVNVGDVDGAFRTAEAVGDLSESRDYVKGALLGQIAGAAGQSFQTFHLLPKTLSSEERKARMPTLRRVEKEAERLEFADDRPYYDLALAWADLGEFDRALQFARRIGKDPIRPPNRIEQSIDPYLISVIGYLQGEAGKRDEALATFREAIGLIEHDPKLASCLEMVADIQAQACDLAGTMKSLEALGPEERPRLLARAAEARAKAGDREGARAGFRLALQAAERRLGTSPPSPRATAPAEITKVFRPDVVQEDPAVGRNDYLLGDVAEIQAMMGDVQAAEVTFKKIVLEGQRGMTAREMAWARTKAGDAEGALTWAMTLEPPAVRTSAIGGMIKALSGR